MIASAKVTVGARCEPLAAQARVSCAPRVGAARRAGRVAQRCNAELNESAEIVYDISKSPVCHIEDWQKPVRVAVTGAAGTISNHLLFKIAAGEVFGQCAPIELSMLGSERSREALEGVQMELEDSCFPLLRKITISIIPEVAFEGADYVLMIGAKPRGPGMERADLLDQNGQIFVQQGQALETSAKKSTKVLVVGNPCNTNAMIASAWAPSIPPENFHALTRLDENRAKSQMAFRAKTHMETISNVVVWGNHSATQVPDFVNAKIEGKPAIEVIPDREWFEGEFTETVAKRGAALIQKWGRSSAASTAVSISDAVKAIKYQTAGNDWYSSAVCAAGNPYDGLIPDDLWFSMPCRGDGHGDYTLVPPSELNLDDEWLRMKIKAGVEELQGERELVKHLLPGGDKKVVAMGANAASA
ncbi:unnamed protein product [Pedinophyceae sp. YPF-701]|nr:unnamed protein product [Pedinophyceae sp. YPF-701]